MTSSRPKRILAIASAGGHWVQLLRLRPAFETVEVIYATTNAGLRHQVPDSAFYVVRDANRWDKWGMLIMVFQVAWLMFRVRPDVVVTTGAAPGYFAIRCGRLLGAKTLWLDSIANSEELSHSGKLAGNVAHAWLTQWPELAGPANALEHNGAQPARERRNAARRSLQRRRPEHHGAVL